MRRGRDPWWVLGAALAFWAAAAAAQMTSPVIGESEDPITIDASDGIEWRQDEQVYIARGNAKATRGKLSIGADVLQAHYREGADGSTEVWRIDAVGNVKIESENQTIYGDKGVYLVEGGVFELTGDNLRIIGIGQTVTARDKLEYRQKDQIARAIGNATATKDNKSLRADVLTAYFGEGDKGKTTILRVVATGAVMVTTAHERALAKRATYDAKKEIVTLSGDVKLTRGTSQLNGEYAEVNLKTGVSRLLSRPRGASGGRPVRGLFVPGEEGRPGLGIAVPGGPKSGEIK